MAEEGIQRLIDSHEILFEKIPSVKSLPKSTFQKLRLEDISIITIYNNPIRITSKGPIRIPDEPRVAPLIIITLGPVPYSSDKVMPWNYGAKVYYHGLIRWEN